MSFSYLCKFISKKLKVNEKKIFLLRRWILQEMEQKSGFVFKTERFFPQGIDFLVCHIRVVQQNYL